MRSIKRSLKVVAFGIVLILFGVSHTGCEYAITGALTGVSMGVAYLYSQTVEAAEGLGQKERFENASII